MSERFNLLAARLNEGLTQRELARMTGVPLTTVQRLEAGDGARPANAKAIADHFGVKVTDLMPVDVDRAA